jgi:nucleotide-binding universal stress UspA family protein
MQEKLLFVTKGGEDCDKGFSYVLELAKTMNAGISVLMVYSKRAMETFEDVMAAAAFAEAGDIETMRELMRGQEKEIEETAEKKINEFSEKCRNANIDFSSEVKAGETIQVIKDFLKNKPCIDTILLSPNLSGDKKLLDIRKMSKNITKPIVTIMAAKAEA